MTSVSAAADIWSVGCLCLELLTGAPPYFELQPMSALFRIVADARPPLPDSLSPDLRDFLLLCFHKVGRASHLFSGCPKHMEKRRMTASH
jgi:serine/threonine protein kinase